MHSDEIIDGVGGMSKFPILVQFLFLGPKLITSWRMLMTSFAGVTPQTWWCVNEMTCGSSNYTGLKQCSAGDNSSSCSFVYSKEKNTVVNEWDFVCDRAGITLFITSVQTGGVLVGALLSGQSADFIGRKKTLYITISATYVKMYSDEIIDGVGGMSKFQALVLFLFLGPRLVTSWGMLMMSFAGVTPQLWWCVNEMTIGDSNYTGLKQCSAGDNSSSCSFVYSKEKNTVVNEWDFVCDRAGITLFITSVQMGGVLVGALLSGQSADVIGRKKTFYIALLLHGGFNLMAAFSVSWQMFIVLRFLIGAMVGSNLVVGYPYAMEFIGKSWRQVTSACPTWPLGSALFAMSCWLRPDWSDQHIILAALHVPFLACWFVAPESLRWLAVHGRLEEAEKVVDQMARYNNREKPANTALLLKKLSEVEKKGKESDHKYNYLDIYRHWNICWKSLVIQVIWMCMSFAFYGITFGVGNLMGNLYLNMSLVSVIAIPGGVIVFFLSSRIGRRWTTFSFFTIATIGAFGVAIISRVVSSDSIRGPATTAMTLICRFGVGTAWGSFQISTSETYPTVIRNLGYGAANTAARVGSIVSPYAFAMGGDDLLPPFVIVGSTMALCTFLTVLLPETNNTPLADTTLETLERDNAHGRADEDVSKMKTAKVTTLEN